MHAYGYWTTATPSFVLQQKAHTNEVPVTINCCVLYYTSITFARILMHLLCKPPHMRADPSSECSELEAPAQGSVDCRQISAGLRCSLSCNEGFEFGSSYDVSPQTCANGIWRYEEEEQEIADCVGTYVCLCVYAS